MRIFIKGYDNVSDPEVRRKCGSFAGAMGILFNLILFAAKFAVGTISASVAITADALNNLSDAGSSILTLVGFKMAGQKPDADHPFGHGRIEYICGLMVSVIIIIMGYELFKTSIGKIVSPEEISFSWVSVIILVAAIAVKLGMGLFNFKIAGHINSAAMRATATDCVSDAIATSVVLIGTVVGYLAKVSIDGYLGLLVAGFIIFAGLRAAKETLNPLLGQSPDPETVIEIEKIVLSHPEITAIHDLVIHDYGPGRLMITLHAEVPADGDLVALHDVIDNAENELCSNLNCHATIHLDPVAVGDPTTDSVKRAVAEMVREIDESISIHDFRMVTGPTHTNLLFDICVPPALKISDQEISDRVKEKVRDLEGNYFAVPKVERSYM